MPICGSGYSYKINSRHVRHAIRSHMSHTRNASDAQIGMHRSTSGLDSPLSDLLQVDPTTRQAKAAACVRGGTIMDKGSSIQRANSFMLGAVRSAQ